MSSHFAPQGGYRMDPGMPGMQPTRRAPTYTLVIKQQPEKARVVVRGKEKDRKPIDPPPIVQFHVEDDFNITCPFLHNPYYFCCCTLWDEKEDRPSLPEDRPGAVKEVLVGQVVSSLHRLKDFNNEGYFVFGDVSVATLGKYRLRFTVHEFKPRQQESVFLTSATSDVFEVVSPKDWDGVRESTALSRAFADQGVRLRLRKESTNSRKRAYGQSTGTSTGPQTPLRPHPSHPGSYGSPLEPADADAGSESSSYKRPRLPQPGSPKGGQKPQSTNFIPIAGQGNHPTYPPGGPSTYSGQYQAPSSAAQYSSPYAYAAGQNTAYRPRPPNDSSSFMQYGAPGGQVGAAAYGQQVPQGYVQQAQGGYAATSGAMYTSPSYTGLQNKYPGSNPPYLSSSHTPSQPVSYAGYPTHQGAQDQPSGSTPYQQYGQGSYAYRTAPSGQSYTQQTGQGHEHHSGAEQAAHSLANPSATPRLPPLAGKSESQPSSGIVQSVEIVPPSQQRSSSTNPQQQQQPYGTTPGGPY